MEVILIFRSLSDAEIAEIKALHEAGSTIFVLHGLISKTEIAFSPIPDLLIKQANEELINSIKKFGDKRINNNYLSDLFTLDGIPLWHYQRFRIFFQLKNDWIIRYCVDHYSKVNNYKILAFVPNSFTDYDTLSGNVTYRTNSNTDNLNNKKRINFSSLVNYLIFFKLRILISLLRNVGISGKKHVVIDRSIRQVCRDIQSLDKKYDNFILYPLFDANLPEHCIISEVETPKLRSENLFSLHRYYFNGEGRKQRTIYGEWILFRGILSPGTIRKFLRLKSELLSVSKNLQLLLLNDDNRSLDSKIVNSFLSLNKSSLFYIFKYVCYFRFFSKHNFRSVTAIDENSPATRCILDAAKKLDIKTVGIQHGNIGDGQPAYLYTERDREKRIMTDLTLTWGQYFTDFLINAGNYPKEGVKTTGQMRSDVIPLMIKNSNIYRNRLSKNNSLVLFASQPIKDPDYRYKAAFDVFSSFKSMKDTILIVKLHPGERFDQEYYEKIAEKAGYKNPDIRYDEDLYELIAAVDIVITCFSTVGSEAVYFGKPLIIYDPLKEDLMKYISEGVAFQVTDSDSLVSISRGILEGRLTINENSYSDFIKKYAYSIDGNATKRTLKILESL